MTHLTAQDLIGQLIRTRHWGESVVYRGEHGPRGIAVGGSLAGAYFPFRDVAPADVPLVDKDDERIVITKAAKKVNAWDPGLWHLSGPAVIGALTKAYKTKKAAVEDARIRLTILDWHATNEAAMHADFAEGIDATAVEHDAGADGPVYERGTCRACGARVMRRLDGTPDLHQQAGWGVAIEDGQVYGATNCPARAGEEGQEATPHVDVHVDGQEDEDLNRCSNGCVCTVAERIEAGHGDTVIAEWRLENQGDPENHAFAGYVTDPAAKCRVCQDNIGGLLHAFHNEAECDYDEAILAAAQAAEEQHDAEVAQQVIDEQHAALLDAADPDRLLQQPFMDPDLSLAHRLEAWSDAGRPSLQRTS